MNRVERGHECANRNANFRTDWARKQRWYEEGSGCFLLDFETFWKLELANSVGAVENGLFFEEKGTH